MNSVVGHCLESKECEWWKSVLLTKVQVLEAKKSEENSWKFRTKVKRVSVVDGSAVESSGSTAVNVHDSIDNCGDVRVTTSNRTGN